MATEALCLEDTAGGQGWATCCVAGGWEEVRLRGPELHVPVSCGLDGEAGATSVAQNQFKGCGPSQDQGPE